MNKKILLTILAISITPATSSANDPFDPEFLKPEGVEKFLNIAASKSKEHLGGIADIYYQYMDILGRYADEQIATFRRYFSDDVGHAQYGHHKVDVINTSSETTTTNVNRVATTNTNTEASTTKRASEVTYTNPAGSSSGSVTFID